MNTKGDLRENFEALLGMVGAGAAALSLAVGGLYLWATHWSRGALLAAVVVLPFGLAAAFAVGFWFGKSEVRGFLGGVDAALDKLAAAVDLRETARVRAVAAARPAPAEYLPTYQIAVSHREENNGTIIDL